MARRRLKVEQRMKWLDVVKVAVAQPPISGGLAYLGIEAIKQAINLGTTVATGQVPQSSQPKSQDFWGQFLQSIAQGEQFAFGTLGISSEITKLLTGTPNQGTVLSLEALQGAILIYIGTAGLSQGSITEALSGAAALAK